MRTIQCPNCGQMIPDVNRVCQFCHAQIPENLRGRVAVDHDDEGFTMDLGIDRGSGVSPVKVRRIYRALAIWFLVTGLLGFVVYVVLPSLNPESLRYTGLGVGFSSAKILQIGLAVGLLNGKQWARDVSTWLCTLLILFGLMTLIGSLLSITLFGVLGLIQTITVLMDLAVNGGMIWSIYEMERIERNRR